MVSSQPVQFPMLPLHLGIISTFSTYSYKPSLTLPVAGLFPKFIIIIIIILIDVTITYTCVFSCP
jgi:hypothetical protein